MWRKRKWIKSIMQRKRTKNRRGRVTGRERGRGVKREGGTGGVRSGGREKGGQRKRWK